MLQVQNSGKTCTKVLVAVGGNLPSVRGSIKNTIKIAFELLDGESTRVISQSRLFRTPAFPAGSGPDFLNAAVEIWTSLPAAALMARLHEIEAETGRTRTDRWEARVLDLDLLAYGDEILPDRGVVSAWMTLEAAAQTQTTPEQVMVPHPRMHERGFVLVPLKDIAPDWVHPVLGKSVRQMVAALDPADVAEICPLDLD